MQPTDYYVCADHAGAGASAFAVYLFGVAGPLVLALFSWWRWRVHLARAAAADRAVANPKAPLAAGPAVVVGRVAELDGEGPAITIAIDQVGREWKSKQGWHHTWTEQRRRVSVRPFYVVRPGGERVRVEPDARVFLIDKLDGTDRTDKEHRTRSATLVAGEPVCVVGTLQQGFDPQQGGYRDNAPALVMRPPRGGRMLISTEPLPARHRARARLHRGLAIAAVVVLLAMNLLVFGWFHLLTLTGRVVDAEITGQHTYRTWRKPKNRPGYWVYHYVVDGRYLDGNGAPRHVSDEVSQRAYRAIAEESAPRAPFVVSRLLPAVHQVGRRPHQNNGKVGLVFVAFIAHVIVYAVIISSTRPWYDRRKVVEQASGRL